MDINKNIRPVTPNDIPAIKAVIDANELFPSDMLNDMMSDYFENENQDEWFTYEENEPIAIGESLAIGIAYCAPERMTEGTWNLYLIAVHPDYQGQGVGTSMVHYIEQMLAARGERVLLVETSSLASFKRTRRFYHKCGYEKEAQIREFYQAGEDKIVFRKSLTNMI